MARKASLPTVRGTGELRVIGLTLQVDYAIQGEPSTLKLGTARLRGSVTGPGPEVSQAFSAGDGILVTETGAAFRVAMLGHTTGSDTAFLELRI